MTRKPTPETLLRVAQHITEDGDGIDQSLCDEVAAWLREQATPNPEQQWKMVPVEPTQEWIDVAGEKGLRIGSIRSLISDVLACAPAHPSQQEEEE
ncbi:hypothetical protein CAL14_05385 [Bordetella genomosp. 9]|uniref:hypothetical protein n=1 Tax=Bordetella genomosp. 9 TaxID=1416803 RepID=UPI000A28DE08|nr:hypothetical protein [Bordetella genomosp. 9]ARP89787.1 hypothetical protein CAL14_05385 [Bordetella genomosp. 9]